MSLDQIRSAKATLFPEKTASHLKESLVDSKSSAVYEKVMADLEFKSDVPLKSTSYIGILDRMRVQPSTDDLGLPKVSSATTTSVTVRHASALQPIQQSFENSLIVPKQQQLPARSHKQWKMFRVLVGHTGQVTSVAFDPFNEYFVTGSSDRTIKLWDLASGQLQLTLTGHIMAVRGLAISDRHPYMFSCSEDKMVKCWDLETNKVIRDYHGHLNSVYTIDIHPTLDLIVTGGRDSAVRVWDIRTKTPVYTLTGHRNTVNKVCCRPTDPQIVSCSDDATVRTWDLVAGKCDKVLTYHAKSVRSFCIDSGEDEIVSGSADGLKKFSLPNCDYLQSLQQLDHDTVAHGNLILNTNSCNSSGVMFAGYDNGRYGFWDWQSGTVFQNAESVPVPGSLQGERGILCSSFDRSGIRLVTGNVDKSVRVWKEV